MVRAPCTQMLAASACKFLRVSVAVDIGRCSISGCVHLALEFSGACVAFGDLSPPYTSRFFQRVFPITRCLKPPTGLGCVAETVSPTAGLSFFYGGLVRDTNIINTMMMSVIAMGVVTMTWVVVGFSLAFGESDAAWVGNFEYALFRNLDMRLWDEKTGLPGLCFATYEMTFAIIASAIISGSLVERVRFSAYVVFLALWSILIYAPLAHWVWSPGGWIHKMGVLADDL